MALNVPPQAKLLSQKTNIEQNLILEIDGIPISFSAISIDRLWKIGDPVKIGDPGLLIGGVIEDETGRDYIQLDKTDSKLTQQLEPDKPKNPGSASKFNIQLTDKNQEVTRFFQPGNFVTDVLGRDANVYLGFKGAPHPEQSTKIFAGVVTSTEAGQGYWRVGVSHSEEMKRRQILVQFNGKLDGAIGSGDTTITLDTVLGLIEPGDVLRSAVRIEDEIIEFTGISGNDLTGAVRGLLGTIAVSHDDESEAASYYILEEKPLDLALKIMLSTRASKTQFGAGTLATQFVQVTPLTTITNGILFPDRLIKRELGLEIGDLVTITGASNGANNVTDEPITAFQELETGLVFVLSGASLVVETDSAGVASFKSQFNVLPEGAGLGMFPGNVDVENHNFLKLLFASEQITQRFLIDETQNGRDMIGQDIYFPNGMFQVPRKARASVNKAVPPLVLDELVELTEDNILNAKSIKMTRSIGKNFYNTIVYRFSPDVLETGKFKAGEVIINERSKNRIDTETKALTIDAKGIEDTVVNRNFIKRQARRYNDRFQFSSEEVKISVNWKTGFDLEVSDIVLYGNKALQIVNLEGGSRDFVPTLMEIVNIKKNIKGGKSPVEISLLSTGFGIDGQFATISMNSFLAAGSTTTSLILKASFINTVDIAERSKWENFIGEEILIRSQDFTFSEVVTLKEFDPTSFLKITVDPALSAPPPEDYLIDLPNYPTSTDASLRSKMKTIHSFWNEQITITAGVSTTVFEISPGDVTSFIVGDFLRVHSADFSDNSTLSITDDDVVVTVVDTILNRITVDKSLGFTPAAGYLVDLGSFDDSGLPYRLI